MKRRIIGFIAPRALLINGKPSPCGCSESAICGYCVQANLLLADKELQAEKEAMKKFIVRVRQEGVKRTSVKIGVEVNKLKHWMKTETIPLEVMNRFWALTGQ